MEHMVKIVSDIVKNFHWLEKIYDLRSITLFYCVRNWKGNERRQLICSKKISKKGVEGSRLVLFTPLTRQTSQGTTLGTKMTSQARRTCRASSSLGTMAPASSAITACLSIFRTENPSMESRSSLRLSTPHGSPATSTNTWASAPWNTGTFPLSCTKTRAYDRSILTSAT